MSLSHVGMRREVILNYLREHPLSSSREISNGLLEESGGAPSILTGSLYIAPWTVYADLAALEEIDGAFVRGRRVTYGDPVETIDRVRLIAAKVLGIGCPCVGTADEEDCPHE